MKSTRKPSHGEALSHAQERSRVPALEAAVRDLLALERLRIESRERLELASMKLASDADDWRERWCNTLAQVLPEFVSVLSRMVERPGGSHVAQVPIAGYGVRPVSTPEPASIDPSPARDDVDDPDAASDVAREATNDPATPLEEKSELAPVPPPVANGVSPGHPLGHIYGEGVAGH